MADFHPSSASDSSSASDCEDDPPIPESVQDKLRYIFTHVSKTWFYKTSLIQFWAPVDMDGRRLLTTSDQPFLLGDEGFEEYRLCCVKYKYNIDVNKVDVEDEDDPTIICTGAQATAFLNHIPELVEVEDEDEKDHQMTPLESSAFQCGLMYYVVLPVFNPAQSCCVGVVEYSTSDLDELLLDFNLLNVQLEKVGLKTFDGRERLPYKTICGLQNAKDEIDEALKIIHDIHGLPFAQVWIPCEDENQVAFSSSLRDIRTKRMLWLKLTGQSHHSSFYEEYRHECLEEYGTACYGLPLKMDKDFTGKTLENYEPHFVNDILELNDNNLQRSCYIHFSCSCFVICLRSTKTRDLDYVFEFLWSDDDRDNVIFLESLLLTLERCLPSFKIASGAEVGDELRILDVQESTESKRKYVKIFQRNQLSPVSVTPKRGRRSSNAKGKTEERQISRAEIESEFGKTQKEAAENLKVSVSTLKRKCQKHGIFEWPGPKYVKRNVKQSHKSQSDTNEEEDNGGAIQEASANIRETSLGENILTIKVKYADHGTIKFHLPIASVTFKDIEKEINEGFKLNPSDYKINYLDEDGDWILLSSDKDMRVCIRNHRNLNSTPINMQVLLRQIHDPYKSLES